MRTTVRSILREHPEVRKGGWKDLPVSDRWRAAFPACGEIQRFTIDRVFSVQVYENRTDWGIVDHLLIRRHDQAPIRLWTDLQRIKNEVAGTDRTAIEVFPAEPDLVDQANLYHLWVLPVGFDLPFGLHFGRLG